MCIRDSHSIRGSGGLSVVTFELQREPHPASERFVEKKFSRVVDLDATLVPYWGVQARAAAQERGMAVDYVCVEQSRGI